MAQQYAASHSRHLGSSAAQWQRDRTAQEYQNRESLGRAHEAFPHNNGRDVQPARNSDRSPAKYANDSEDVEIDDEPEEQDDFQDEDFEAGGNAQQSYMEESDEASADDQADDDDDEDFASRSRSRPRSAPRSGSRQPTGRASAVRYVDSSDDDDDDDDGNGIDDEVFAQKMHQQLNSSRPRRAAAMQATAQMMYYADDTPQDDPEEFDANRAALGLRTRLRKAPQVNIAAPVHHRGASHVSNHQPMRASARASKVSYAEEFDSELDSDPDDAKKKSKANMAVALMDSTEDLDDEVERVLGHREAEGQSPVSGDPWANCEFHIKWKRYAYIQCSWDTRATLSQLGGYKRVVNYMKRWDDLQAYRRVASREEKELQDVERCMEEELVAEHMQVERVIHLRLENVEGQQQLKYLVKWKGLPYGECTFETPEAISEAGGQDQLDQYEAREQRLLEPTRTPDMARRQFKNRALERQPDFLQAGTLRDYQLDGLNWLVYSWYQDQNCILADEMGLGKTVQCVSLLGYLSEVLKIQGPFLVVVPLSTVPNWIKEFRKWTPQLNALVYVGDSKSREVIRTYEFYNHRGAARPYRFEVIITTYELVLKDASILNQIKWNYMMVDEAHRLKNHESALYQEMTQFSFKNRLLITGTPLQNSIKELWALLHFLDANKFPSCEHFEAQHSLDNAEQVGKLHAELRPHLLRRVIKDVEKSLPPKNERILRVEMSPLQRQYYKWILTRNFKELNKGSKGGQVSLLNIITELKKTCNHPFLFESAEEDYRGGEDDLNAVDRLVVTSGKMVLLDKLMKRLKETGHRVLIFSQMVRVLDIISDYMRLRGFQHQRLDGSTPSAARHQAMEHFNAPGSGDFAFLLSTRAGGLGINLATADTVVIFDSDWNPQNDLQAMSRAHRIGQKDTVNIYRFLTSGSVEEDILNRAKQKMVLDHLVIQRMDTSGRTILGPRAATDGAKQLFGKDELASILKFGAEELFKENEAVQEEKKKQLYEEGIDAILARAEVVQDTKAEMAERNDELLSSFNVASFKSDEDDQAFWNRLIPVDQRPSKQPEVQEDLGIRTARLKFTEDVAGFDDEDGGASPSHKKGSRAGRREGRVKGKGGADGEPGAAISGATLRMSSWPPNDQEVEEDGQEWPATCSRRDANLFLRGVKRFGTIDRLPDIAAEIGPSFDSIPDAARVALWNGLLRHCNQACKMFANAHISDPSAKEPILDFFGVSVKAEDVPQQVERMYLLKKKIEAFAEPQRSLRLDIQLSIPKWGKACGWTARDDAMLMLGVHWHGLAHWENIAADERLGLGDKLQLACTEKKGRAQAIQVHGASVVLPTGAHLETRVLALLKKMQSANLMPHASQPKSKQSRLTAHLGPKSGNARKRGHDMAAGDMADAKRPKTSSEDQRFEQMLDPVMLEVKKLRTLQRKGGEMDKVKVLEKTRKYLRAVGDHIQTLPVRQGESERKLWAFVSSFTENKMDGDKLSKLYAKLKANKAAPSGVPSSGGGGNTVGHRGGGAGEGDAATSRHPLHRPNRAERAQRLGRHGSDPPSSLPPPDATPPSGAKSSRREDGEIMGESPSTGKHDGDLAKQPSGRDKQSERQDSLHAEGQRSRPSKHDRGGLRPSDRDASGSGQWHGSGELDEQDWDGSRDHEHDAYQ
ncbi:hypothetical protein WJX77_011593 [Trebouxia sp. C0004]